MAVLTPPGNVHEVHEGAAVAWCVPRAQAWVQTALGSGRTLYDDAAARDDRLVLRGRGPVYAMAAYEGRWVVRRYRRGGAVAPVLGDRFLRVGTPRPFEEMAAADEARRRGIPTPPVLAAAVYRAGAFYRGDLVTEYVAGSRDLASLLFGADAPRPGALGTAAEADPSIREAALRDAGYMLARMARAGVEHPDLNAKNVLVEWREERASALLVDLDRVRIHPPGQALPVTGMRGRLERSLHKFERATSRCLTGAEWRALREPLAVPDGS